MLFPGSLLDERPLVHEKLVDVAPQPSAHPQMLQVRRVDTHSPSSQSTVTFVNAIPPSQANAASSQYIRQPHIHIANAHVYVRSIPIQVE
jgi:hypothetical protein